MYTFSVTICRVILPLLIVESLENQRVITHLRNQTINLDTESDLLTCHKSKKLGVALVGLGIYSTNYLAPALLSTRHCYLKGIVTGTPSKASQWKSKYALKDEHIYDYDNMQAISNDQTIDVIYIVLPTGLHAKYAIKAAETGKHIWCEKPMARTAQECQDIIDACRANNVKLSIGYRLHHEDNTQAIVNYAQSGSYGRIETITSEVGYCHKGRDHWKHSKRLGGGAIYDLGVYSINVARNIIGEEPVAVFATHEIARPEIYNLVDETTIFQLEFPGGVLAKCEVSLGKVMNDLRIFCDSGWLSLSPFQLYSGIKGITSSGRVMNIDTCNQQVKQMDNDALAIINKTDVMVSGEEGLKDIRIVEAICKSAATNGQRVVL
ncbi:MAG: glucose-fructose oxidoreductase [Parasphingorhabdus sp.]